MTDPLKTARALAERKAEEVVNSCIHGRNLSPVYKFFTDKDNTEVYERAAKKASEEQYKLISRIT